MNCIPKVIHYCWFGGKEKPTLINKCIKSWKEKLPGYEIVEWNEKNFDINMSEFSKKAYEDKKWAFVADYCRLWVLHNYGGIYLDTDVEVLKPIDDLLINKSFTGIEQDDQIAFGVWGCTKGDKFLGKVLKYYNDLDYGKYKDELLKISIPVQITKLAKELGYKQKKNKVVYFYDDIAVYPKDYFYPKRHSWEEAVITENTYSIHHYEGSWRNKRKILRSKIKNLLVKNRWLRKLLLKSNKGCEKK